MGKYFEFWLAVQISFKIYFIFSSGNYFWRRRPVLFGNLFREPSQEQKCANILNFDKQFRRK